MEMDKYHFLNHYVAIQPPAYSTSQQWGHL